MKALHIQNSNDHILPDALVVERVLSGEKELYEILLRRNNQTLYRVIRGYITDGAEIEDLMQNTYMKAFEKLHQFKQDSTFSTWLIRIGINEALARLRRKSRMIVVDDSNLHGTGEPLQQIDRTNPEREIIRKEAKRTIEAAIDSLEPHYRSVYIMREVEELTTIEIAESLGISVSNVKVRLHRAKAMLKGKLEELTRTKEIFEFGSTNCDQLVAKVMNSIA